MKFINCVPKEVIEADCGVGGDTFLIPGVSIFDDVTGRTVKLYAPVNAEFEESEALLFDAYGHSYKVVYGDTDKTRGELEDLLESCGCCEGETDYLDVNLIPLGYVPDPTGNITNLNEVVIGSDGNNYIIDINGNAINLGSTGGVTWVDATASGALSFSGGPITSSGTFTLGWTGTSSQLVLGDGSFATYTPINWADQRIAFGQTSVGGLNHSSGLLYHYNYGAITVGSRAAGTIGAYSWAQGNGLKNEGFYSFLMGDGGVIESGGSNCFVIAPNSTTRLLGAGNKTTSFVMGAGNSINTGVSNDGYRNFLYGANITVDATGGSSSDNVLFGIGLNVSLYGSNYLFGRNATVTHSSNTMLLDDNSSLMTSTAHNHFTARFYSGYRFANTNSQDALSINVSGQTTLHQVPLGSTDDYLLSNASSGGGMVRYRTVASLPFTNNTGTVTQVELMLPNNTFSISGSPVNTTGILTGSYISQTAKHVLAAPWGFNGTPIWRQLQTSDLQQNGATLGQVVTWDGTAWTAQDPTGTTYTGGTGISVAGSVITNTLPSKWSAYSTYVAPTLAYNIRSQSSTSQGWVGLARGSATESGFFEIYRPDQTRMGYIGYYTDNMSYFANVGYHRFMNAAVQISTIPNAPAATNFIVDGGSGVLSYRTISSIGTVTSFSAGNLSPLFTTSVANASTTPALSFALSNINQYQVFGRTAAGAGVPSYVTAAQVAFTGAYGDLTGTPTPWLNQVGGAPTMNSTTATYHNASVLIGGTGSSSFMLEVVGTFKFSGDGTFSNYLNTRADSSAPLNYFYSTSTGLLQSRSIRDLKNDFVGNQKLGNQTITAGAGMTAVTFTANMKPTITDYTITSNEITLPATNGFHIILVSMQATSTSGTSTLLGELRKNGVQIPLATGALKFVGGATQAQTFNFHGTVQGTGVAHQITLYCSAAASLGDVALSTVRVTIFAVGNG